MQIVISNINVRWIVGVTTYVDADNQKQGEFIPRLRKNADIASQIWLDFVCTKKSGIGLPQPSSFWSKELCLQAGLLDENLHYALDHEFYIRLARLGATPNIIEEPLAIFHKHEGQKTSEGKGPFWEEEIKITWHWIDKTKGEQKIILIKYLLWLQLQTLRYKFNHIAKHI
jgi:hypothetical protein